jgi:hypothetical protein
MTSTLNSFVHISSFLAQATIAKDIRTAYLKMLELQHIKIKNINYITIENICI